MSHAIDPWADPPAELVDPFATHEPARERLKTSDMHAEINSRIATSQRNDPPLCPQLVQKTLRELAKEADAALPMWSSSAFARWLLEQLHHRAVGGIPYDETQEPAWSLDPDPRPYERVLSDDVEPGDLG